MCEENAKALILRNVFQKNTIEAIRKAQLCTTCREGHRNSFAKIEVHLPLVAPSTKVGKCFIQNDVIFMTGYCLIDNAVIGVKTDFR